MLDIKLILRLLNLGLSLQQPTVIRCHRPLPRCPTFPFSPKSTTRLRFLTDLFFSRSHHRARCNAEAVFPYIQSREAQVRVNCYLHRKQLALLRKRDELFRVRRDCITRPCQTPPLDDSSVGICRWSVPLLYAGPTGAAHKDIYYQISASNFLQFRGSSMAR